MKKIISILLILTQTSILFADTLTFNNGVTIEGKLVKYDEDYLIFKVDEESMKDIPNEAVIYIKGVILDENQVVFNNKFVKNVTGISGQEVPTIIPAEEKRNKTNNFILMLGCVGVASAVGTYLMFLWIFRDW